MEVNLIVMGTMSAIMFKYIALVMVLLGCGLCYWINSRWFNRRNLAGLEAFNSYKEARVVKFVEG